MLSQVPRRAPRRHGRILAPCINHISLLKTKILTCDKQSPKLDTVSAALTISAVVHFGHVVELFWRRELMHLVEHVNEPGFQFTCKSDHKFDEVFQKSLIAIKWSCFT